MVKFLKNRQKVLRKPYISWHKKLRMRVGRLRAEKCMRNNIVSFIINDDKKMFYYISKPRFRSR